MRTYPKRYSSILVGAGTDDILCAIPMPPHSTLKNVWGSIHLNAVTAVSFLQSVQYAIYGYVVPIPDPDTAITPIALWGAMIPKDKAVGAGIVEMDTGAPDTQPIVELGEINIEKVMGLSTAPEKIYERQRRITVASPGAKLLVDGTPDTFIATDIVPVRIKANVRTEVAALLLIAGSSPSTTTTVLPAAWPIPATVPEWFELAHIDETVRNAFIEAVGRSEAAADEPYTSALAAIASYLETAVEEVAGDYLPTNWNTNNIFTAQIDIDGFPKNLSLSGQP